MSLANGMSQNVRQADFISGEELFGDFDVEVYSFQELFLGELFKWRMGYVDGAGTEQERLAPVTELGNVGGEFGDHGGEALDGAKADERNLEGEVDFGEAGAGLNECGADGGGVADETDEYLGLGFIGNDIGSMAALDLPDVEGAGAHVFDRGQRECENIAEDFDKLVDRAFAEFGIGGVGHFPGGFEYGAQSAFGGEGEAVVSGLAVDEKAAALGCEIGGFGAGGVALFAGNK